MEESRINSTCKTWEERNHPLKESIAQKYVLKNDHASSEEAGKYKLSIDSLTSIVVLMSDRSM